MRCFYRNRSMKSKGVIQILVWFTHLKKWHTYNFATRLQCLFATFAAKLKI